MRWVGLWIVGCCCVSSLCAQNMPLHFEQTIWNFGTLREEAGKVSHRFAFRNEGSVPVVIERVEVSCGCTTPEFSREPVRPKASGFLTITYDPKGRPGTFRKEVTVWCNGGGKRVLTLTGEVTPDPAAVADYYPIQAGVLRLSSEELNLGYVPRDAAKAGAIELYNQTEQRVKIEVRYEDRKPFFEATLTVAQLAPKQKGAIILHYNMQNQDVWGIQEQKFTLVVNGQPLPKPLSVTGVVTEDFSQMDAEAMAQAPRALFSAQYYHFGNQRAGVELRQSFTLTNEGKTPLIFRDMSIGSRISTTLDPDHPLAPGAKLTFEVRLSTRDAKIGKLMDRMILITNDPSRPMREIRLATTIVP
ncbi:MAG: DUF1573 domain-containing protein [Alistipes sp.]|nr:DUF1573 domain-containing protein [Alistipes sp.]